MTFEWDARKAATNRAKHRVDFADLAPVFDDPRALVIIEPDPDEERHIAIGTSAVGEIVVVVFVWRGDTVRIISARTATRREIARYEGHV